MWMVPNAQRLTDCETHRRLSSLRLRTDEMQSKTMSGKKVGSSENSSGYKKTYDKKEIIKNPSLGCADRDDK